MFARRQAVRLGAALAVLVVAALSWASCRYGPSAALILDLSDTTSALRPFLYAPRQAVSHRDFEIPTRHGQVPARVYTPAERRTRTVVVYPGIHAGDVSEPRLAAFSSRLSAAGYTVVSVPLPDLRRYLVTPVSTDIVEDATSWVAQQPALAPEQRVTLVGVSFAGGLAIVAAGRPALADRLTGVVSLGGHGDLPRVMRYLSGLAREPGEPAPHDYGTAIIMLAALPRLLPADLVAPADRVVRQFLDASSLHSTDPDAAAAAFAVVAEAAAALPEPARDIVGAVVRRDVKRMGVLVDPWIEELGGAPGLSPMRSDVPRVPVFLLHGQDDPVIPSSETPRLADYLRQRGTPRVHALVTPLLRHADVHDDAPLADVWNLVAYWREIMTH